jgi:phi13 family phage major tail protein
MARVIGLKNLHYAILTSDTTEGVEYETPKRLESAINLDIQDNTEQVTFYSDDKVEQVINAYAGKEVTLELGYLPNELEAAITGNTYNSETGIFSQDVNAVAPEIALIFEAPKSNGASRYGVLYKGVFAVEGETYATQEDSVEGQTVKLKGVFMPLTYNGKPSAKLDTDSGASDDTAKNNWFKQVVIEGKNDTRAVKASK